MELHVDLAYALVAALAALCAGALLCVGVNAKKYTMLDMEQKLNMAARMEAGESAAVIAKEFGVHPDSVRRIKRKATKIRQFATTPFLKKKIRAKALDCEELDKELYSWFVQSRSRNTILTGAVIQEKARELYAANKDKWGCTKNFAASNGWLEKFKKRHGIREECLRGERNSADEFGATAFVGDLQDLLVKEGIALEDVYNMDETGVCWKTTPTRTLVHGGGEKRANGHKLRKDRFTAVACANATGTHRLPLLVIGHYAHPRCFERATRLPVHYRSQKNARMNGTIFMDWLVNVFTPLAERHQERQGRSGVILLLLDNLESHNLPKGFNSGKIKVMSLPPNTTSLIQPMDQSVISKTKRLFRQKFIGRLLESPGDVAELYALKDAVCMLADSWSELTRDRLRSAWRKLLPVLLDEADAPTTPPADEVAEHEQDLTEMLGLFNGDVASDDVRRWLREVDEAEREVTEEPEDDESLSEAEGDGPDGDDDEEMADTETKELCRLLTKFSRGKAQFIKECSKMIIEYIQDV